MAGVCVPFHVLQNLLEYAEEHQLGDGGHPPGQPPAGKLEVQPRSLDEPRNGATQRGDQAQDSQDARPQSARDAFHILGSLFHQPADHRRLFPRRRGPHREIARHDPETYEDDAESLGDVIVQFQGHVFALNFLRLQNAAR